MLNEVVVMTELTNGEILIRLGFAIVLGAVIGLERGSNKRPAGLRTHMLVCVGSCVVMMTNLFLYQSGLDTDPARLGAQVVTGMGFLGAGSILLTSGNRIKGLTTAAGLWASACLGLAIGSGFYIAGAIGGLMVFLSLSIFHRVENVVFRIRGTANVYVEVDSYHNFRMLRAMLEEEGVKVSNVEFESKGRITPDARTFIMSLTTPKGIDDETLLAMILEQDGVHVAESL